MSDLKQPQTDMLELFDFLIRNKWVGILGLAIDNRIDHLGS